MAGDPAVVELTGRPQWVVWRWEKRNGKLTKPPYQPNGEFASSTDPTTWAPYEVALAAHRARGGDGGVGFAVSEADPYLGIDLDHCREKATGAITTWAMDVVERLSSYTEVTPSGTGLRVIVRATWPGRRHKRSFGTTAEGADMHAECYDRERYFTVSGQHLEATPETIEDRQAEVDALYRAWWPPAPAPSPSPAPGVTILSDLEILELVHRAKNASKVERLLAGDFGDHPSASEADLALLCHLAFYTRDADQLERLWLSSGLGGREHLERDRYRERTIERALQLVAETYSPIAPPAPSNGANASLIEVGFSGSSHARESGEKPKWPDPPSAEAFYGLAGEIVDAVRPHTEADPIAILAVFMASFGNLVGPSPHHLVGETRHPARICPVLVGPTAKGRKGEAQAQCDALLSPLDPDWARSRGSGLASGEGLIHHVRDPVWREVQDKKSGELVRELVDAGVDDKRLVVVEAELGRTLRVMHRDGNTLSALLRDAWDDRQLRNMTRNSPLQATGAHVTIVGHITLDELREEVKSVDLANGFLNRLVIFCVRRAQHLPRPRRMVAEVRRSLQERIGKAVGIANTRGEVPLSGGAEKFWDELYPELTAERPGMLGAMTARSEPYVLRLALVHALLDCRGEIATEHLEAALAVWRYAERSVEFVFGDATGNPTADAILAAVRRDGPLARTAISDALGGHVAASRIDGAVEMLLRLGRVRVTRQAPTAAGGRPRTVVEAVPDSRAWKKPE